MSANKKSSIVLDVELDENFLPEKMNWTADGAGEAGPCDAFMLAVWEKDKQEALRIDLWTKDMMVEEMKLFTYQNMITMADTYARATGDNDVADDIRKFANEIGGKMGLLKKAK